MTPPSGYTQTYDPDATVDNAHTVTVSEGQSYLLADFRLLPARRRRRHRQGLR
ncbi:MAG: hypothetical protein R3A10_16125 [Caldilineaceae bacterium]